MFLYQGFVDYIGSHLEVAFNQIENSSILLNCINWVPDNYPLMVDGKLIDSQLLFTDACNSHQSICGYWISTESLIGYLKNIYLDYLDLYCFDVENKCLAFRVTYFETYLSIEGFSEKYLVEEILKDVGEADLLNLDRTTTYFEGRVVLDEVDRSCLPVLELSHLSSPINIEKLLVSTPSVAEAEVLYKFILSFDEKGGSKLIAVSDNGKYANLADGARLTIQMNHQYRVLQVL